MSDEPIPIYDAGNSARLRGEAGMYRKALLTRATRLRWPFKVETSEGLMECEDGWLAWDVAGNPYPIAANVFAQSYDPFPVRDE